MCSTPKRRFRRAAVLALFPRLLQESYFLFPDIESRVDIVSFPKSFIACEGAIDNQLT